MLMLSFVRAFAVSLAVLAPLAMKLATWMVARSLNMPQPIVHDTGEFVVAQVTAVEMRVGKALCPVRLLRQLRTWFR